MSEPSEHARLSPSGAKRWMTCPGSVVLEEGLPEWDTGYADEGTAAHELAKWCLVEGKDALAYLGRIIEVSGYEKGERVLREFEVDEDFAGHVQTYVEKLREYAAGHELLVEQRVPIGQVTGEADAQGTSDGIVITSDGEELQVHDLKFGRGVRVDAQENPQGMLYALGALHQFSVMGDFKRVRIVIHQPRLDHLSEWDCTVEELQAFARKATDKAGVVELAVKFRGAADWAPTYLTPSDEACQFCKAKATCPALAAKVVETVGADFETLAGDYVDSADAAQQLLQVTAVDPDALATKMRAIDLIEDWCKAIRAEVERLLFAGQAVPGYKLVQGKRGNRAWSDEKAVEDMLRKQFRLTIEEAYTLKLISPTQAEKLLKENPKRWQKLKALVTQGGGKPSVAPESDKRPALVVTPTEDDFAPLDTEPAESLA